MRKWRKWKVVSSRAAVEAQTGTCMCVEWFMIENVKNINLSSRTSLTTIPIYVTWWFMEGSESNLVLLRARTAVSVSVCVCLRSSSFFWRPCFLTEPCVCSASFKLALEALPQLHSGTDKKWVSRWAAPLKCHLDSKCKGCNLCTGYVQRITNELMVSNFTRGPSSLTSRWLTLIASLVFTKAEWLISSFPHCFPSLAGCWRSCWTSLKAACSSSSPASGPPVCSL